jgi:hypothetical protein
MATDHQTEEGLPDAAHIERELQKLQDLGVIQYYIASVPAGEAWVVGTEGQILNMTPKETACFLAGVAATTMMLVSRTGFRL